MSIKPALTPEEWKESLVGEYPYIIVGLNQHDLSDHGIAAKLLHGEPFGFTREDVRKLREDHDRAAETVGIMGGSLRESWMSNLAGRIEALLPPEGE